MHQRRRLIPAKFLALLTLLAATLATAQDAVMSTPAAPFNTAAERQTAEQNGTRSLSHFSAVPGAFFTFGPIALHPSVLYRFLRTDGLPVGAQRVSSDIQTIAPTFQFDLGRQWALSYNPVWTYYSDPGLRDTVDQSVSLHGAVVAGAWAFQAGESYSLSSPTLIETGQQTKQKAWLTSLSASRNFGSALGLQLNADLAENYTDQFPDTRTWSTQDWLTVQLSSAVDIGIGPGAGYIEIFGAPDMTFERYMARLNWSVTRKISLSVNGGMEYRHSRASSGQTVQYPTINASLQYRPFDTTSLGFSYARELSSSYFRNQVNKGSSWNFTFEQRLLSYLFLSGNWSHSQNKYEDVTLEFTPPLPIDPNTGEVVVSSTGPILISFPGRSDRSDVFGARLTLRFLKRLSLAATYQHSKNSSNQDVFGFKSTQYGMELSWSY